MNADAPSALGPLFGPDFIMVTVDDDTKTQFSLEIYPDANNPLLKANGIAQQYYFVPQRVYVAKKQDSPSDFDFGMTVFKGLMTTEDSIGVTAGQTSGGDVEAGGGFCTFSTTFAIPNSVIANAITALKNKNYSGTSQSDNSTPQRLATYMDIGLNEPAPLLGIVPILSNDVYIDVPQLAMSTPSAGSGNAAAPSASTAAPAAGTAASAAAPVAAGAPASGTAAAGAAAPASGSPSTPNVAPTTNATQQSMQISAQCAQKGSIEAAGISSFLVTCNELAAGAIAGSLQNGISPFTVYYNLTEQFYLPACDITVSIDVDKVYDSFSVAASASGWFSSANFQAAWSTCITSGGIVTDMKINEAALPDDLKTFVEQNCQQMQTNAINAVKSYIFDWNPTDSGPATASTPGGVLGSIFGGASVSVKSNYQRRSMKMQQELKLDTTITKADTKSGDLSDLEPAIKANLSKYLAIVDIGKYFSKIQVAATNAINWKETLPNGTSLADPLTQAMIEVAYPNYSQPLGANNAVNLQTLGQGYHYQVGQPTGQSGLAMWNANNPMDVINISFLRLDNALAQWPQDQVQITKTLVFDANDPRVDLSNNQTTIVINETAADHTPILTGQEVGYCFARFMVRPIPAAVSVALTITLGPRTDTLTLTGANQNNALWEVFSDKYFDQTQFTYSVSVTVQGPNWTDNPIVYASPAPIVVPLPPGRVKYVPLVTVALPDAPAAQVTQINQYILQYQQQQQQQPAAAV